MERALRQAGREPGEVDYVCAGSNGSVAGDRNEAAGIAACLGECAANVPVGSVKSTLGETIGAGTAVQLAACLTAIESGHVPPTVNLEKPDCGADLNFVTGEGCEREVRLAMVNSVDEGGAVVCLVVAAV
jgi:3-oxoacyl-(acyl-carrier-protein) synthase